VHSFAGDDAITCRDYVRAALGFGTWERGREKCLPSRSRPSTVALSEDVAKRSALALRIWNDGRDARGTVAADYLASRGITLADHISSNVIRFQPTLKFGGASVGAMLALFRDIRTNEPCGIHRTFLDGAGRKLARKMLGRCKHAAVKLDADENVELGLTIGEGVETCLAARLAGFRPVWSLGSSGATAAFPVLAGIDAITILGEVGDGGANDRAAQACAARWMNAGQEAFIVSPCLGSDLNDVWLEVVR
jgi:putative DNA primase/helicase